MVPNISTLLFAACILISSCYVNSQELNDVIKSCKSADEACAKVIAQQAVPAFAAGSPALGIQSFDPFHITEVLIEPAGLKLKITEGTVYGLKNSVIDQLRFDVEQKELLLGFHVDCNGAGKYDMSGQLLVLPISGKGDIKIDIKNVQMNVSFPFEVVKKADGKEYIKIKEYKYDFDFVDGVTFDLTNLFNGNKELGETTLKFMNENWKAVAGELAPPLLRYIVKAFAESLKKFFHAFPLASLTGV